MRNYNPLSGFERYNRGSSRDSMGQFGFSNDTVGGGMVFLEGQLEKQDSKIREPLTSTSFWRDVPQKVGGGFIDYTSFLFANYASSSSDTDGIIANQTSQIAEAQADVSKDVFKVFNWGSVTTVPFIDMQKLKNGNAPYSIQDLLYKAVRLNWAKANDRMAYQGLPASGIYGLMNADQNAALVAHGLTRNTAAATFAAATPQEIQGYFNTIMINTYAAAQYDISGMATQFLVDPSNFALLTQPMVLSGVGGARSIWEYILANNFAQSKGLPINIFDSRWCIGAGNSATNRLVGYANNEERLVMAVPVPVTRGLTAPIISGRGGAYRTEYLGQLGQVAFLTPGSVSYLDGI